MLYSFWGNWYKNVLEKFLIFKPYVNYISVYETLPLANNLKDKSVYANHWHTDDTLDPTCVKFFNIFENLNSDQGPMEFLNKSDTKLNWKNFFYRGSELAVESNINLFTDCKKALFLDSRSCLHRAGVPKRGKRRLMLMMQIINKNSVEDVEKLYKNQLKVEPTILKRSSN